MCGHGVGSQKPVVHDKSLHDVSGVKLLSHIEKDTDCTNKGNRKFRKSKDKGTLCKEFNKSWVAPRR